MSITGGTLQSVLTSYSFYSTQSSSKHSSTGIANSSSSTTGDIVSLSAQSLSGNIETDSGSTTVELSAQSVSVTVSSELGDYDLTNITPAEVGCMANILWQNGIISSDEMSMLTTIASMKIAVEGIDRDSAFNLTDALEQVASGTYYIQWTAFEPTQPATNLLDLFSSLDKTTVKISSESISAEVKTESVFGDYDLTSITPDDLDYISAEFYNNGIISKEQFLTLGSIAFYHNHANGHVVTPDDSPFNLLNDLKEMASGNYDIMSACTWNWNKNDQSMIAISLLDILTDLEDDTSATVEVDYSLINISITA